VGKKVEKERGAESTIKSAPRFLVEEKAYARMTTQRELGRNRGTRKTYSGEERQLDDPFPNSDEPDRACSGIRGSPRSHAGLLELQTPRWRSYDPV